MNASPLGIVPVPRASAAEDVLTMTVAVGGHICPTLVPSSLEGQAQGQLCPTGHRDNSVLIGHGGSSMSLCQHFAFTGHRGDSVSPVGWGQLQWLCDTMECDTSGCTEPTAPYRAIFLVLGDRWALKGH